MDGKHQQNGDHDDRDLGRRQHQAVRAQERALVQLIGGGAVTNYRQQDVGEHQRGCERDDHHPDEVRSLALEGRVQESIQQEGKQGAGQGGADHGHPDVHAGLVEGVRDVSAHDHDLPVGEVDHVGDPELHGEADRGDRDDGNADRTEAKRRYIEFHGAWLLLLIGGATRRRPRR